MHRAAFLSQAKSIVFGCILKIYFSVDGKGKIIWLGPGITHLKSVR